MGFNPVPNRESLLDKAGEGNTVKTGKESTLSDTPGEETIDPEGGFRGI